MALSGSLGCASEVRSIVQQLAGSKSERHVVAHICRAGRECTDIRPQHHRIYPRCKSARHVLCEEQHALTRDCSRRAPIVQAFLILACYFMLDDVLLAGICYFLSGFLDHFDGHAARKYDQCSQFGATLDMVTDRVATTLLVIGSVWVLCALL